MGRQQEALEQKKVINWARANQVRYPKLKRLFHPANGGLRTMRTAVEMGRLGVRKGVADLILLTPGIPRQVYYHPEQVFSGKPITVFTYHFFAGEMKAPGGKLSLEQIEFRAMVEEDGGYWCCHEKAVDMVQAIKAYLLIDS